METDTAERLRIADLEARVRELEETLDAIRSGEVDAIVVSQGATSQVYALEGPDHPYRSLVENIQEGALTLTANGLVLYGNTAFARMRGAPLEHVLGSSLHDQIEPGDRERFDALLRGALAAPVRGDLRLRSGAGPVPVLFSMTPLEVNGETLLSVVVTDRRQDFDRLQMQARMLEAVADAVIATGPDGRILYWNESAAKTYGWTASEAVDRCFDELAAPELREGDSGPVRERPGPGETWSGEFLVRHRDGHRFPVHAHDAPVYGEDGGLIAVISASHDISERTEMERALTESLERYRQALNSSLLGYALCEIVTDEAGSPVDFVYREINPAFEAFTGLGPEDVLGRRATELFPPGEIAEVVRRYGRVALTGEPETFEYTMPSLGKWYEIAAFSPQHGEFIAFFSDVTERRRAQEGLKAYAERLRTSNEELQRFAYVASHDLQEPLRSIVSFSQLLERRYRGRLGTDADDYIGFIVEGGNRMQALIRDLLQLSRIETAAKPPVPTDANGVAADAVRTLRATAGDLTARITVEPLPTVMVDPPQLEQVLTNLVGNALKYHRPGVPPEVRVSADRREDLWEFSVADNGIGIEEQYFDRIFQMFQRLHTREEYEGTGIGLAVVKKIVERHGGTIRVESVPGEGTTFHFTLPAA
jgi:PAS domain S-box-containing protein